MATLAIRDLDEEFRARLRVRAAQHGRSMEAEVREILRVGQGRQRVDAARRIIVARSDGRRVRRGSRRRARPAAEGCGTRSPAFP